MIEFLLSPEVSPGAPDQQIFTEMQSKLTYPFFFMLPLFLMMGLALHAGEPDSKYAETLLFTIERSRDPDEIWYTVNTDQHGSVNPEMPVKVFWLKKSAGNRIEALTGIQKRFSYGIQSMELASSLGNAWRFRLEAYKNRVFTLKKGSGGHYRVYTLSEGREVEVKKLYVKFDGGSFLAPSIGYVQLTGIDPVTGKEIKEYYNK
ncbi:MAG: DUF4833 domain-containing protein [Bacteroidales bacterium]|nr:DUF4833 domain-containing protein [Bacteroidales bacterium]